MVTQHMAEASYPPELLYHPEHDWARVDGDVATFGITWHAQDALGEIVFVETPAVGTQLSANEAYTEVESVKAVSDVFAPLTGEVIETNAQLAAKPELINEDPYGEGWLVKVRIADASEAGGLLDRDTYVATLDE
jgi:glycine cleavage system H protein